MSSEAEPAIDSVGDYDVVAKIAEGGMGAVYKGRHKKTGQTVAIKIVPENTAKNSTLMKRFEREFNAAHEIDHPNVVRAIEFRANVSRPFLVMEFVDGESLGQKLDREKKLSEDEALRIIMQVCQGLHRAHKHQMIHRDVKPDNILLMADGTAKLTDLGLVKGASEDEFNLTRTGRGLGTPHFMAPEQFRDAKNADRRCDVYSVGATLYTLVTGHMPFDGNNPLECWTKKIRNDFVPPKELVPELSERTNWAILRAMSADPVQRPSTCREFVEDLLGQTTRPTGDQSNALWYVVYRDQDNQSRMMKGTVESIRQALDDQLLGLLSDITVSQSKEGPFEKLAAFPEFRDIVVAPKPLTPMMNANLTRHAPPAGLTAVDHPALREQMLQKQSLRNASATLNYATIEDDAPEESPYSTILMFIMMIISGIALGVALVLYLRYVQRQ
jgi:serine/threonine protein kinase